MVSAVKIAANRAKSRIITKNTKHKLPNTYLDTEGKLGQSRIEEKKRDKEDKQVDDLRDI